VEALLVVDLNFPVDLRTPFKKGFWGCMLGIALDLFYRRVTRECHLTQRDIKKDFSSQFERTIEVSVSPA